MPVKENWEQDGWLQSIEDSMRRMEIQDAETTALRRKLSVAMTTVDQERIARLEAENARLNEQVVYLHEELSGALQLIAVLSAALRATYSRMVALAAMVRAAQLS